MIAVAPEADFVAGLDAQFVAEVLRNHDLPFGSHSVSHTDEYNLGCAVAQSVLVGRVD